MTLSNRPSWDVFCKVVDNFGDIGVCWRFARQLAAEYEVPVRLWVDDLVTFHRINATIDTALDIQASYGVEIRRWPDPFPMIEPAEVVVEAFGCEVPESFQVAMSAKRNKPVWINLEYLSAESWVNDCHRLPSPHPRLPLTKYYFFPGFAPTTGGLLREKDLLVRRDMFREDSDAVNAFWQSLGLPPRRDGEVRISLFCYENLAIADLFSAWTHGTEPIYCLVPDGVAATAAKFFFTPSESISSAEYRRGSLTVRILPFVDQPDYDRLLWACDCNFVRGEDSFVRAQWAAMPFIWHIYPQKENAHWIKLNAFIDQYCSRLTPDAAAGLRTFWRAWNSGRGAGQAWPAFWRHRAELRLQGDKWAEGLVAQGDLTGNLVQFCHKLLKF